MGAQVEWIAESELSCHSAALSWNLTAESMWPSSRHSYISSPWWDKPGKPLFSLVAFYQIIATRKETNASGIWKGGFWFMLLNPLKTRLFNGSSCPHTHIVMSSCRYQLSWPMIFCIFNHISFWLWLWRCFWMTSESVELVRNITLLNLA